jgi:hypothetical protein
MKEAIMADDDRRSKTEGGTVELTFHKKNSGAPAAITPIATADDPAPHPMPDTTNMGTVADPNGAVTATSPNGAVDASLAAKQAHTVQPGDDAKKPTLEAVLPDEDEDEAEFRKLRRDLPGVKGSSALGIVSIGVGKDPGKNAFFRTCKKFRPSVPLVNVEVGMEKQFFAVDDNMVVALAGIGITVTVHTLYLTVTPQGGVKIIPVNRESDNDYNRTKEIGLVAGITEWVRLYTDQQNKVYKVFPAPVGRFADPIWPELKHAKIFRMAFRDKGRLVDSPEHPLFLKWAARDRD